MTELYLEYQDEKGELKRLHVVGESCFVGRHSGSDVCIPDARLSRKHLKIDRFGDVFVVSDAGSSNGSVLNGQPLKEPTGLKKGDVLELGGLRVEVKLESDEPEPEPPQPESEDPESSASAQAGGGAAAASNQGSSSMLLWIVIPVFALVFILFAGAVIFLLISSSSPTVAKKQSDVTHSDDDFESDTDNKKSSNKGSSANSDPGTTSDNTSSISTPGNDSPSGSNTSNAGPAGNLSETAKVEQNAGGFLRGIAQNDPRAFLLTEQAAKLSPRIKQFSGSSAVADNLRSANKNAAKLKSLAESKKLKPKFLAIAAIAKLGTSRGDVLQTAESMTEVLHKLATSIGTERADDAMLVIAAYGQGAAGDTLKMRDMLQDLANKSPESARAIRTIWFLQKNGKITQAEYEAALNFLAIGTISQNPKDFGVNAEALTL